MKAASWFVGLSLLALACSSPTSGSTVVAGSLSLESYPSKPQAVEARDEAGAVTRIALDDAGRFSATLAASHRYTLSVVLDGGSVPVVFPRKSGALESSFAVGATATTAELGSVRHFAALPADMVVVRSNADDAADGECENGVDATTGAPCVDDDDDQGACEAEDDDDVECENGVDPSGQPCTDDDDHVDANQPMAIPEHNLGSSLGCSEDDDAEVDDD